LRLSELGERRVIELFVKSFKERENIFLGIGDDACAFGINKKEYLVLSTDMVSRRTHIPREMTPHQVGMYVVNVNLSDIASMGATPLGILLSFGLPGDLDESYIVGRSEGIEAECERHGIAVIGGDTKEAEEMVITGTAIGRVGKRNLLTRRGAKVGEKVCVTGAVGTSAAGFYTLVKDISLEKRAKNKLLKAALEPKARVREGTLLARYASSCMDISDGLAYSLHEVSEQSGTGFLVREESVPVEEETKLAARKTKVPLRELVFHKGGDFELLFTINVKNLEKLEGEMEKLDCKITVIGEVTKKGMKLLSQSGEISDLEARGHEAFLSRY